jgi:hypothetical protein
MKRIHEFKGRMSETAFDKEEKQFFSASIEHPFIAHLRADFKLPDRSSSALEILPDHCEVENRKKGG